MEPKTQLKTILHCPVCQKGEFTHQFTTRDYFLTQEEFSIDQCNSCGFAFTNPVPIESELGKYYDSPDYLSHTANKVSLKALLYQKLRNINIKRKYKLVQKYKQQGRILDIGCGTGELLDYFNKKTWSTLGIEPYPSARKFAQTTYDLSVFDEEELLKLDDHSFDVISMWHVLEHVPNLKERMAQARRLLKKDGYMFIALPNFDSPDARKYKAYWAGLDVPRHLYHFTKSSFKALLEEHNLNLVDSIGMKMDAYYVSLLSEKYLKKSVPAASALMSGFQSNSKAKKENNYSSMIFVVNFA